MHGVCALRWHCPSSGVMELGTHSTSLADPRVLEGSPLTPGAPHTLTSPGPQDCLELMTNLLRGNAANQRLYREMGHIALLPRLLQEAAQRHGAAAAAGTAGAAGAANGQLHGNGLEGGADGGGDEGSLELHAALSALAAAGQDALLGPRALPRQTEANMLGLLGAMQLLVGVGAAHGEKSAGAPNAVRLAAHAHCRQPSRPPSAIMLPSLSPCRVWLG